MIDISGVIAITVNVNCKLCTWTATYAVDAYAIAAKDAALHLSRRHPEDAKRLFGK
jgi:hypothetical protein